MIDLTTNYLGLKLKNPVVVSASPLTEKLENFPRLEDAGASAIVMYSLFEEQIEAESENIDSALEYGSNSYAEATSYLPDMPKYHVGPDRYLELLRQGKAAVSIPVIASLNGSSPGGWVRYSEYMEQAGRGRTRAEHLRRSHRSQHDRGADREPLLRPGAHHPQERAHPHRGQAGPVLHLVRELCPQAFRSGRRRHCDLQSLLSARLRSRRDGGGSEPGPQQPARAAAAAALGRHPLPPGRNLHRHHRRRARRDRRAEVA